ncbi:MAG TPA: hypothetical protein DIC53_01115, partial [Synergistaceae bacterium]|nr:hypothetical protein [Synergistaceae bacterium]
MRVPRLKTTNARSIDNNEDDVYRALYRTIHALGEGVVADLEKIVAENLKRIRSDRKLSLDGLAALTGVSKSMLGQIERGESSPTLQTVWKIANGLRISLTELTDAPKES